MTIEDKIIEKSLDIFRLTSGEQRKAIALLEKMRKELIAQISTQTLTDWGKRRTNAMLADTSAIIDGYYEKVASGLDATMQPLAQHEASYASKILVDAGYSATAPTTNVINSLVGDLLIQGAPSKQWWDKQANDVKFQFTAQIRQGVAQGRTNQQIIKAIEPIIQTSKNGAAALVHTSVQTVTNAARLETFKSNSDIIRAVRQLSTLDSHTSDTCVAYSGQTWDLDGKPIDGSTLPFNGGTPRHFRCRSVLRPILYPNPELDGIPEGTRASDEGQIKASTTFSEFLDRKSTAYQDDLLGKGRAQLWRDGKITLKDLVDQNGRPITLDKLTKKYS